MAVILVTGIHAVTARIPLEVFPSFELDIIAISVPFRGATPEDVEEAVVTRIEEAIFDLEGIKEIRASAREGVAGVTVEVASGFEPTRPARRHQESCGRDQHVPGRDRATRLLARHASARGDQRGDVRRLVRARASRVRRAGARRPDGAARHHPGRPGGGTPYEIAVEVRRRRLHQYGSTSRAWPPPSGAHRWICPPAASAPAAARVLLRTKEQAYVDDDFCAYPVLEPRRRHPPHAGRHRDGARRLRGEPASHASFNGSRRCWSRSTGWAIRTPSTWPTR